MGRRVLSRYRLERVLARGGAGTVYEAHDEVARGAVAVKVLDRPIGGRGALLAHVRREVACLRLLRLPGVVQLHDDGIEEDRYVLAMDLVVGTPFPGVGGVVPWRQIAHPTLALVETMDRVHAVGVVHGDLKPLNVLVGADGRPVVLDLGVSGGPAIDVARERPGPVGATLRYMSPEHARGDPVGYAADLYPIGLMVYEALSGRRPHDTQDVADLYEQRRSVRPLPLREVAPTVEPEVAAWVDALLESDPETRVRASQAALARVPGHVDLPARVAALEGRDPRAPLEREALEALFTGPRRIHHLPEDGATALLARTDGTPARVVSELSAWVRAGLARWDGDGVAVDRPSLERLSLAPGMRCGASGPDALPSVVALDPAAARLSRALASGGLEDVPAEAERFAEHAAPAGRSDAAQAALDEGIRAAQALGWPEVAERLLLRAVHVALDQGTLPAFDRLLHRLALVREPSDRVRRLEGIVRAALAAVRGESRRALGIVDASGAEADDDLQVVRASLRVRSKCAEGLSTCEHEALLTDIERVVDRFPGRRHLFELLAWQGWLRFRQSRYAEAAALFRSAADGTPHAIRRAAHLAQAAEASMEVFALDEAERDLGEALRALAHVRHPFVEARVTRSLRGCAYRRALPDAPDLELVRAVADMPPVTRAVVTWTEAAFAWRLGRSDVARELLAPWVAPARGHMLACYWALGTAFAVAVGVPVSGESQQEALGCGADPTFPAISLQILGLFALRDPERVRDRRELLLAHAGRLPRGQWGRRREILSVEEALAYARCDGIAPDAAPG